VKNQAYSRQGALDAMQGLQTANDRQKATIGRFLAAIRYASQFLNKEQMAEVRRIMKDGEREKDEDPGSPPK